MTTALDWISGGDDADNLEEFTLLVAQTKSDPYDPETVVDDWNVPPVETPFEGALSSGGSSFGFDPARTQLTTSKTITIFDADFPVDERHRIRAADGVVYKITGRPERDRNPWTGWRPTVVVPVEEVNG